MPTSWTRRRFINTLSAASLTPALAGLARPDRGVIVNDVHSRLTPTRVSEVLRPESRAELVALVRRSLKRRGGISVAGGRHSMGAQAFGTDTLHLDLTGLKALGDLDTERGIAQLEPGLIWPDLMDALDRRQASVASPWCIAQKQTGADSLTLGGAVAANIHGRGLAFAPFVQDIESLRLLTASGDEIECSRAENADWFRLAMGGYGLFGIVTSIRLRLMRRQIVRREASLERIDAIPALIEKRIAEGCLYGDFQFSAAAETDGFLRDGILSIYRPAPDADPQATIPATKQSLSTEQWKSLIALAHSDKAKAFKTYTDYYRTTDGQLYESDRQQTSTYLPDYHEALAEALQPRVAQSLVITELYLPRDRLIDFFDDTREDMRRFDVDLVYGVVRWIEPDRETFLPWARERYACVIFNLNVRHDAAGLSKAADDFRRLIARALERGGSYYLTYHRHATRQQVESAHPRFAEMLAEKERRDPDNIWNSDWFRHYREMFS